MDGVAAFKPGQRWPISVGLAQILSKLARIQPGSARIQPNLDGFAWMWPGVGKIYEHSGKLLPFRNNMKQGFSPKNNTFRKRTLKSRLLASCGLFVRKFAVAGWRAEIDFSVEPRASPPPQIQN